MDTYAITYDLHKPSQEYDELHETIKDYGGWWHCLESIWLVNTDKTTKEIRDDLKQIIDSNDELLVMEASKPWHSWGLNNDCEEWLHDHM